MSGPTRRMKVEGKVRRRSYKPGWRRLSFRIALGAGVWEIGYLATQDGTPPCRTQELWKNREQVLATLESGGIGAASALSVGGAAYAVLTRERRRELMREWVVPLHESLHRPLGYAEQTDPRAATSTSRRASPTTTRRYDRPAQALGLLPRRRHGPHHAGARPGGRDVRLASRGPQAVRAGEEDPHFAGLARHRHRRVVHAAVPGRRMSVFTRALSPASPGVRHTRVMPEVAHSCCRPSITTSSAVRKRGGPCQRYRAARWSQVTFRALPTAAGWTTSPALRSTVRRGPAPGVRRPCG